MTSFQSEQFPLDYENNQVNPDLSNLLNNLFKTPQQLTKQSHPQSGSLLAFNYSMWIHDPYPLVIVTDVIPNTRIRGLNLHYLTFPYIKTLLKTACQNNSFSYGNIKNDAYITNAFRSYKWQGVRQVKMLDCSFLLNVMASVRTFDPNQVSAIRQSIREQMQRVVNPPAESTEEPTEETSI